ncbi:glycosyltransferase [Streptomyces sp. NPDC001985]|uniref:glycosyltransferase n=1 Tax=Streptomyces sp. NPDC001985 TaxID=3154406 RepID=UPI00333396A8
MRLYAHDPRSPQSAGTVDGAVLMHREAATLIAASGLPVSWHDLTRGPCGLATAGPSDVVYAGSGPYAHLHHAWREETGGGYRIVREVHTALWSGYWTQEELCAPLTRPGDLVLFPTEYTRGLYLRHLPGARPENSAVVYPLLDLLPPRLPARPRPPADRVLRIGYLGALSLAKNFDQVLSVVARCGRRSPVTLLYAGKPNHPRWEPASIGRELAALGAAPGTARTAGVVGRARLAGFFADIDVLLFPSTASRETLGRVVLESLTHGVPVLAADAGPAAELLPARNLVPTLLDTTTAFTMDRVVPLGRVDEDALVAKLLARDFAPAGPVDRARYGTRAFLRALAGDPPSPGGPCDPTVRDRLTVSPRPEPSPAPALSRAREVFAAYFTRRDDRALLDAIDSAPDGTDRAALREIVRRPHRDPSDYRAFPRLVDALVLPPLGYGFGRPPDHDREDPTDGRSTP